MDEVGNTRHNAIYEARVPPDRSKPLATASREEREAWIRDKYCRRLFVDREGGMDPERSSQVLFAAAREADLEKMVWALAHKAEVNWINEAARGRTPVHAVCEGGSVVCLELLYQNGGNLDVLDQDEVAPLELAMKSAHGTGISKENSGTSGVSTPQTPTNPMIIAYILSRLEKSAASSSPRPPT